jgi:hypothetical protein
MEFSETDDPAALLHALAGGDDMMMSDYYPSSYDVAAGGAGDGPPAAGAAAPRGAAHDEFSGPLDISAASYGAGAAAAGEGDRVYDMVVRLCARACVLARKPTPVAGVRCKKF